MERCALENAIKRGACDSWRKGFTMMIEEFEPDKYTDKYLGGYIE